MAIVPLTLTISLSLVFTFIIFFLREHARGGLSSAERDSLLPLADEKPLLAEPRPALIPAHHHHGGGDCGCHDGSRRACAGCRRLQQTT
jgi:hypothetical protein